LPFSEQLLEILSPIFTHLLDVYSLITMPKAIFNYAKFLDFSRNHAYRHFSRLQAAKCVQNERRTTFAPHTNTLLFEQHNKRFGSENLTCPLPAFTHAFIFLVKFLTTLLMASCPRSLALLPWA